MRFWIRNDRREPVALITEFDPWRSNLCTCPPKLTFNPYTGCDHGCRYCYASSYVPRFSHCRPKKNLIERLKKEVARLRGQTVSISNSSDPYPNLELKAGLTRECMQILSKGNCRLQIITKSDLVVRDLDILKKARCMVSMTITTADDQLGKLLEPGAPRPSGRLQAVKALIKNGIPTSVRLDPLIPFLNDDAEGLVETLASLGVRHVTCSTYKARPDNWHRIAATFPTIAGKLEPLYFSKGQRIAGYYYLPDHTRFGLMARVGSMATNYGLRFGTCREGLSYLNTATCDGSWLMCE